MTKRMLDRRIFLIGGAVASTVSAAAIRLHDGELGAPSQRISGGMPWTEGLADAPPGVDGEDGFRFFTSGEARFVEAVVDRLIPPDAVGPGAVEAGVAIFLDRQLAGLYGRGDHFYLGGPWPKGTPEQGYQSRYNPAQLYRAAIGEVEKYVARKFRTASFAKLAAADQDEVLAGLESGAIQLGNGVDAEPFFALVLQNTKEGYFSDPVYGGNRDMAAWKMIGFPGAHYDYSEWVPRHFERVPYPTVGFRGRPGWKKEA